jgi:hypothetical protein
MAYKIQLKNMSSSIHNKMAERHQAFITLSNLNLQVAKQKQEFATFKELVSLIWSEPDENEYNDTQLSDGEEEHYYHNLVSKKSKKSRGVSQKQRVKEARSRKKAKRSSPDHYFASVPYTMKETTKESQEFMEEIDDIEYGCWLRMIYDNEY